MTSLPTPPAPKPIAIGSVRIDCPVILAPMTGVTDRPFRKIVKQYGAGLTVTEMIASQAMIRETRQSMQKAAWDPIEDPVSMQLAGCSPVEMAEAARLNEDRGAAIIDAIGPTLEASVETQPSTGVGAFGQGSIAAGSTDVVLGAPAVPGLVLLAIALALVGGPFAGAVGGLRAARLRPAEALRSAE